MSDSLYDEMPDEMMRYSDHDRIVSDLRAQLEAALKDAERYRWLRDLQCNSFSLARDDDQACNYMTAAEWIETNPESFEEESVDDISAMKAANTIWSLQIYPNTPIGFNRWNRSTLDGVIDAARSGITKGE